MRMTAVAAILVAAALGGASASADPAPAAFLSGPPPLSAYGRLPLIEDIQISPDGALIAVIITDGEDRALIIKQSSDGKIIGGLKAGAHKVRAIQWAGSDHLLMTASVTSVVLAIDGPKREWWLTLDYNVRTGRQRMLMDDVDHSMNVVASPPEVRMIGGKPYALIQGIYFGGNVGTLSLFRANLDSGDTRLLKAGDQHTVDWVLDAAGEPLAESEFDAVGGRWSLKMRHAGAWGTVKALQNRIGGPSLLGLGRDGRSLLLAQRGDTDVSIYELAPDAVDWDQPLATGQNQPIFDGGAHALIGLVSLDGETPRHRFFNPADQAMWNAVVRAYGAGSPVSLASMSDDHKRLIVMVDSPTEGPAYAYIDRDAHTGQWLGETYKEASAQIGTVTPIAFKAADGTPLSGYLTLPRGRHAKGLPLVVFPHGGPAARDTLGFDWWAQAMASRGYAVLQVNYRGSDGFGWDFLSKGFGEWGRKMQTDLSDGVRYLAAQETVDPKRVCIVGASYGGYAALAGATLDQGVYRCAASIAGPSELRRFVVWSRDQSDISAQRYWLRYLGADRTGDPRLEEISPADHADQASAPILLIHGRDDTVVPFSQTQLMADALKRAGKPYELVVLKHEDHWLSHGDTRLQMLEAVMAFLEKNNPPG